MRKKTPPRLLKLDVSTPQGPAGALGNEQGSFFFVYGSDASDAQAVSLLMPPRLRPYSAGVPPPVFSMNLPEGYVLEMIRERLAKIVRVDPLLLLAVTGDSHPIGRLTCHAKGIEALLSQRDSVPSEATGESLTEILHWDGAEDIFAVLVDRYILRSGISGVQPKVVVPDRARTHTVDIIVKSGGYEYPHLAVNEYICMSIAREAGMAVPEFWLSDNRELFVMRRFDREPDGQRLGFEDFAALTGRQPDSKYEGSYEMIAQAIGMFVSEPHRQTALAQLFDTVALSCIVENGDAHLKNFGVLYAHPAAGDTRLAPVYDIVNTTAYLPEDCLALKLRGSKAFAGPASLEGLADACSVSDPHHRINTILDAAATVLGQQRTLLDDAPEVGKAIAHAVDRFDGFRAPPRVLRPPRW